MATKATGERGPFEIVNCNDYNTDTDMHSGTEGDCDRNQARVETWSTVLHMIYRIYRIAFEFHNFLSKTKLIVALYGPAAGSPT